MYVALDIGTLQYTMLIFRFPVFTHLGGIYDKDTTTVYKVFTYLLLIYISIITIPYIDI